MTENVNVHRCSSMVHASALCLEHRRFGSKVAMGIESRPYMFLDGEQQLKMADPAELNRALGKLGTEDAERVSANNL